jgi:glycerophosphoryl diester phosphodiesterase
VKKHGAEVHFWTINDPAEMKRLVAAGASGIVTDRADLAVLALRP